MADRASRTLAGLFTAVAGVAGAVEEPVVDDLRVEAGRSPQSYTARGQSDFDTRARRVGLLYAHSFDRITGPGAYLGAVEISGTWAPVRGTASDEIRTAVGDLMLGYAWAPWPAWHGELTPYAGLGRGDFERVGVHARATAFEIGVRGAAFWTSPIGMQIGVDVRYIDGLLRPTVGGERITVQDKGVVGMVALGWRF